VGGILQITGENGQTTKKMDNDNIEIIDPENYRGGSKESLNHSQIVKIALVRAIEAGCVEMREGYMTLKKDKFGNELPIYVPDTRLVLIECIETVRMSMGVDMDEESTKKIKELEEELKKKLNEYLELEKKEWDTAPLQVKIAWKQRGIVYLPQKLNKSFFFYNEYLLDKVAIYRRMYVEMDKLAYRKDYWKEEFFEG